MKKELQKAEQQILGFYHRDNGGNIEELCSAMGLTKQEYERMIAKGMLDYLPQILKDEILEYINNPS